MQYFICRSLSLSLSVHASSAYTEPSNQFIQMCALCDDGGKVEWLVCAYILFFNPIHCKNGYLMKLCGVYTPQSQPTKATPPFSIDHNFWLMHIVIICVCVCVCAILSSSRKYHTIQDHKSTLMVYFQLDSPLLISLKYKYDIGLYVYT